MKAFFFRLSLISVLWVGGFSMVSAQNTQEIEAKKKALTEEKAKLPKPYNSQENAEQKLKELAAQAKQENKKILVQVGGNWCIWCLRFNQFILNTPELNTIVEKNYLYYHLNHSPENKNEKILKSFGNPEKYGFPVFVVLDNKGELLHTQDSAVLEEGNGYSVQKVKAFLEKYK